MPSPGAGAAQAAQGDFAFAFAAAAAAAAVVALAACAAAFPAAVSAGARRAGAPSHEARAHCCFLHRSQAAGAKSRRPRGAAPWRAAAPIWPPPRLAAPRQPRAPRALYDAKLPNVERRLGKKTPGDDALLLCAYARKKSCLFRAARNKGSWKGNLEPPLLQGIIRTLSEPQKSPNAFL